MGMTALAVGSIAAMAAATATSTVGSAVQASQTAAVAKANQNAANASAALTEQQGRTEMQRQRNRVSQIKGQQRAGLAASGVIVDQDSAADVLADTAEQGELDARIIKQNYKTNAWAQRTQGSIYGMQARSAISSGYWNTASTLLSGASKTMGAYSSYFK
jgi:hypothetical protein